MKYKLAAVGGTFDFLHKGHKAFLLKTFSIAEHVLIGLTSNEYTAKYKNSFVSDFAERNEKLLEFLNENKLLERVEIISLTDPYGPAITNNYPIDVLIVTADNEQTGKEINKIRANNNLYTFDIVSIDLVSNNSWIISSSYIRGNIMDVNGNIKIPLQWLEKDFFLPEEKRYIFQKPFGKLLEDINAVNILKINAQSIVTVGDVTTKKFNEKKLHPKLAAVDFFVERRKSFNSLKDLGFFGNEKISYILNPAGSITSNAWETILKIVRQISNNESNIIMVKGEEDLLVIPLAIVLPLGFTIYYGQPHEGLVELDVTNESKQYARQLMGILKDY